MALSIVPPCSMEEYEEYLLHNLRQLLALYKTGPLRSFAFYQYLAWDGCLKALRHQF